MDITPSNKTDSLRALAYRDLLLGFKESSDSPFTLNEFKTEFHRRSKNRLYQRCLTYCQKNRLDDSTAKEIFQKTILKAFEKLDCFEFEISWSEEKLGNKIAAWLNRIAYNLFIDLLKERSKYESLDDGYNDVEDDSFRPDDFEFEQDDTTQLKLQDAWDSLTEREKLIVNLCIKHNCLENKNHLPDDVIADICTSLKINKGNIRSIKYRALVKMRLRLK